MPLANNNKMNILDNKYKGILREIEDGKSLKQISKERNIDHNNLRNQLRKRFSKEYDRLIYGEIIGNYKGYKLRKIPRRQTDRTETNITKKAKEILKKHYNCIEEVGVWNKNFSKRYTSDLYLLNSKIAIELYWQRREAFKQLKDKLNNYRKFSKVVICALLKDSKFRKKNRTYYYLKQKLKDAGFKVIIIDISNKHPITEIP